MGVDHAREYAEALAALIPDEPVLAATVTKPAVGFEPAVSPTPVSHEGRLPWWQIPLAFVLALGSLIPSPDWPEWVIWGRAARGEPTSIAARVRREVKTPELHTLMAVTRRWVYIFDLLDTPAWVYLAPENRNPPEKRLRPRCRIDRRDIRTATAGWYRLNPGRLVLHFVDGSWTAFGDMMFMGRSRANKIAGVLRDSPHP